jgi:23S rRNA (adenine2503-C2)-methyltransferase
MPDPIDLPVSGSTPATAANRDGAAPGGPRHLLDETLDTLRAWMTQRGQPAFRANQILQWIYDRDVTEFGAMTNLSKPLRAWLRKNAVVLKSAVAAQSDAGDGTRKLLLSWDDGAATESVWIPETDRHTVCVSSQVGCPVGCRFCASGSDGVQRDLTAGEIVEQVWRVRRLVGEHAPPGPAGKPARLSNVVFMGMGEPLANYRQVMRAIRIINAPWGLNIGARKITVSTVGLPTQIRRLATEDLQLNLALSLHAPDDALRRQLIPWGKVPIAELVDACSAYFQKTGREITLEYVLLDGVNMSPAHAAGLAAIARRLRSNVNLLRYNPVPGLPFRRPAAEAAHAFKQRLLERGVNAHIRTSRGRDVDAACGQLRRRTGGVPDEPRTQPGAGPSV